MRAAMAAAEPADEPPGVWAVVHGFRVEATDPREACLDQIDGAHAAGPDALGRLARAEPGELNGGHRAPRPRPRSARTTASGRRPRSGSARRGRAAATSRCRRGVRRPPTREAADAPGRES